MTTAKSVFCAIANALLAAAFFLIWVPLMAVTLNIWRAAVRGWRDKVFVALPWRRVLSGDVR